MEEISALMGATRCDLCEGGTALTSNILNFTTVRIVKKQKLCQCDHSSYEVDAENRLVTCITCGAYIDPFDALLNLASRPEKLRAEMNEFINRRNRALKKWRETMKRKPNMIIFKELEQAYRRRKGYRMLPRCPKCHGAFRFEDIDMWTWSGIAGPPEEVRE
jgi:hypothetical protein